MTLATFEPTPEHDAFYAELQALARTHLHLPPVVMLALVSQFAGSLVACLDPQTMTGDSAAELIQMNVMEGNRQAVAAAHRMPVMGHA